MIVSRETKQQQEQQQQTTTWVTYISSLLRYMNPSLLAC